MISRLLIIGSVIIASVAGVSLELYGQQGATVPATKAARPQQDILSDLQATSAELQKAMRPLPQLLDEKTRAEVAPKALPPLKKLIGLLDELSASMDDKSIADQKYQFLSMAVFLGDKEATQNLLGAAEGKDAGQALKAKIALALPEWWTNHKNPEAQQKILDRMRTLARDNPTNIDLAQTLLIQSKLGAANTTLARQAREIVAKDMKGPVAQQAAATPEEGKPLTVQGPTVDGKQLDTAAWKGKVVLVDFWATWCGPCVEEMPELIKLYEKYHGQGLEIVGVSLDQSADDVKKFVGANPGVKWPQIYQDGHPLAKRFGIETIPTMYLIDRQGNLVTTEARGNLETLVPKLLKDRTQAEEK